MIVKVLLQISRFKSWSLYKKPLSLVKVVGVALLSVTLSSVAWSASKEHDHLLLPRSSAVTYTHVFEQAFEQAPEAIVNDARQRQAASYQHLGNSWMSGSPKVSLNYIGDSSFDNIGQTEMEAGLEFQLWSIGAKRDSERLGQSFRQESDAWQDYFKWVVAGRLRTTLADIREAEIVSAQAQRAKKDAQKLYAVAEVLFKVGETSRSSVLQAQSMLLEQEQNLLRAEAMLVDAERMYTSLTGLFIRPEHSYTEAKANVNDIQQRHVLLQFLQASVDVAGAQVRKVKQESKGSPTLSVGMRRQRGNEFEDYTDSLAVGISIPFGGSRYVSAKSSDAFRTKVDAQVQHQTAYRQLLRQLHEAEHELAVNALAIKLNEEQKTLSQQRSEMARKAFEAGETRMTEVVMALQQYHRAETEYQLMQMKQQRLISEFNQAVGVLP